MIEPIVVVDNTKYTFFIPEGDWRVHVLRFGEPWLVIEQGHKAIAALMYELQLAQDRIKELTKPKKTGKKHKWLKAELKLVAVDKATKFQAVVTPSGAQEFKGDGVWQAISEDILCSPVMDTKKEVRAYCRKMRWRLSNPWSGFSYG